MTNDNIGAARRATTEHRSPWLGIALVGIAILSVVAAYLAEKYSSPSRTAENTETTLPVR